MKTFIISISFLLVTSIAFAQTSDDTIVVAPGTSGMYFYHIVQKGESTQSLSNKFGSSPKQLIALNSKSNRPLKPYETIKIPIKKGDIVQSGNKLVNKNLPPLYHKVLKGETLFRIGKLYGDIPLSSLKSWNNLQNNTIHVGKYLIVGWLQPPSPTTDQKQQPIPIEKNTAPATTTATATATATASNTPTSKKSFSTKDDGFLSKVISSEKRRVKGQTEKKNTNKSVSKPLLSKNTTAIENSSHTKQQNQQPVSKPLFSNKSEINNNRPKTTSSTNIKNEIHKDPAVKIAADKNSSSNAFEKMLNQSSDKPKQAPHKKQQSELQTPAQSNPKEIATISPADVIQKDTSTSSQANTASLQLATESVFSELYNAQTQDEKLVDHKKGAAGWFKSNIKPGSKKYYALCNDLPRGTIIKVINPINKRFIYAKVLSSIPKSKENYSLIIKLSNAAMTDLGTDQPRFWSEIVYPKVSTNNVQ